MLIRFAIPLFAIVLVGCGDSEAARYAPVSGIVTVNGKPEAKVRVHFLPDVESSKDYPFASAATTDDAGRFSLKTLSTVKSREGAFIGPHKIRLTKSKDSGSEMMPAKYNDETILTTVIPPEGNSNLVIEAELANR